MSTKLIMSCILCDNNTNHYFSSNGKTCGCHVECCNDCNIKLEEKGYKCIICTRKDEAERVQITRNFKIKTCDDIFTYVGSKTIALITHSTNPLCWLAGSMIFCVMTVTGLLKFLIMMTLLLLFGVDNDKVVEHISAISLTIALIATVLVPTYFICVGTSLLHTIFNIMMSFSFITSVLLVVIMMICILSTKSIFRLYEKMNSVDLDTLQ
jgi:hypothetical protein